MKVRVFLFVLLWSGPLGLFAQLHSTDSAFLTRSIRNQRDKYQAFIQANSSFYNGYEYKEIVLNSQDVGTPYFLSDDWVESAIVYNQKLFTGVDLLYDIVNNKIITHPYNSGIKVELVCDQVDGFEMEGRVFVRLNQYADSINFYERLSDGRLTLFALRKKNLLRRIISGKIIQTFIERSMYFVLFNDSLTPIKKRHDLFRIFPQHKPRIKRQLAERKIRFKRNFEDALVESVAIINSQPPN